MKQDIEIPVSDLELGMHVTRLDRPWSETQFMLQGFILQSQDELQALQLQCKHVYIETNATVKEKLEKRKRHVQSSGNKEADKPKRVKKDDWKKRVGKATYINKVSFEHEFDNAKEQFTDARSLAKSIMDGIRIGRTLDMSAARKVVEGCVDSLLQNNDALLWLTQIKNKDEYTAEHSMNVCVLSANFARHLGLMEEEIKEVGLCGLLHDVGKTKIPDDVLNKPGQLTPKEFTMMKGHTIFGRDILMSAAKSNRIVVDVAHSHHERENGSGYPRGLESHQIPFYAKLVALTDTYDAITSSRCYEKGRPSMRALKIINENKVTMYDETLAAEFIKCIGIYPPGCIVEMTSGVVGIVIKSSAHNRLRPKVMLVTDEEKNRRILPKLIDMRKIDLDEKGDPFVISHELLNGDYGIDLREYLEQGLVLKEV